MSLRDSIRAKKASAFSVFKSKKVIIRLIFVLSGMILVYVCNNIIYLPTSNP